MKNLKGKKMREIDEKIEKKMKERERERERKRERERERERDRGAETRDIVAMIFDVESAHLATFSSRHKRKKRERITESEIKESE